MASHPTTVDSPPAQGTTAAPAGERLLPDTWERGANGRAVLFATRCARCGTRTFPVSAVCPHCWERADLAREALPQRGTVAAFSVVHVPADGIAAPYAIAYVDFPGGIRLCGRLTAWSGLVVGDEVEAVAGVLRNRAAGDLVGWLFQKVA